ncbi:hydroxypyruvate isomerase family protein [Loktanella agnita]|uniref:hydroxypyruvate isomerase family protein n=1 Tax=Loktanella agnita TaxID=287097 RepID=UPI0039891144
MQFSANLGFLWAELALPDAIRAARAAGFDAVECHWPYECDPRSVRAALDDTGLEMLGLNTLRGDVGENGLSALPHRRDAARAAIAQAVDYATQIRAANIHVMAGFASGDAAHHTFVDNLIFACDLAADAEISILIEPLNRYDAPGYFLQTTEQAIAIIAEVAAPNIKLMFDCYHVQLMEGDLSNKLAQLYDHIGHIQFASVPDRAAPDHGEVNFDHIFGVINRLGYARPLGAEYKPQGPTEPTLDWLRKAR